LAPSRQEVDLSDENSVDQYFAHHKPGYVFLAAAHVGGIGANSTYPVDFLLNNLKIQNAVISASYKHGVKKLLFLGSSCIYPKHCPQPMKEDMLLTGPLEPTNEAYAVAKIAGIKLCQAYKTQYGFNAICAQPTNLYGPNDNFSNTQSHVLPALVRRIVEAKENNLGKIVCWGTGTPTREFLYVDDLAEACVFLMNNYDGKDIVNVGTGKEISIAGLVSAICKAVGWEGDIEWDSSKPDGTPRKVCDVSSLANMGWVAKTDLEQGIRQTVDWYLMNRENARK
jgi:GDP-L-fucose synthase